MVGVEVAGGKIIHENVRKSFASVEDLLCFGEDGNGNERPVGRAFRFRHSGTGEHEMNPLTLVGKCHLNPVMGRSVLAYPSIREE